MPSRRHTVLAILLCASVVFLLYSLRSSGRRAAPKAGGERGSQQTQEAETSPDAVASVAPGEVEFSRYELLAKSALFGGSKQEPPPKETPVKPAKRELPPFQPPPVERMPATTGWSYLGYVIVDGKEFGIVKNESSGECRYLAEGEDFLGSKVEEIGGEAMRLRTGSSQTSLSRNRDFSLVPLSGSGAREERGPRQQRPR